MIRIKRVYSEVGSRDGMRILVDRVWPRGISKDRAHVAEWRKDLAPSTTLRKWFGHEPARWTEFRRRYRTELVRSGMMDELQKLRRLSRKRSITLVYGAADETHNQAAALMDFITKPAGPPSRAPRRRRA
ncbi:conserved protein of unknown function [Nitrospira japonica]|uniref:Uroporphyrin-III C-methyltransferase n=1 Tax=Nitrospira japonica TaxID=1325564 RepID=A0A1W1I1D8_9BACT|nr:DUF488 family protein [Nitrospira japonica]SLM46826.1 conserved protein of unknown function [Nitrospira japonica]